MPVLSVPSNRLIVLFYLCLVTLLPSRVVLGAPGDGYVIITSRDTILGEHGCFARCEVDADCVERQRCIDMREVGRFCLSLRERQDPPRGWTACEADLGCSEDSLCARKPAPQNIDAFMEHKRARGFEVRLIDETLWGGGEGDEAADNIRTWLQANYEPLNLRYLLLLGDPRPTGDVPMRGTRPANNAYQDWAGNPVVLTDFYFAELDGDWDLDGDGLLGEYPVNPAQIEPGSPASAHPDSLADDMGPGGVNRDAEIAVGRIPFYGDVAALDHILQKTMDYENAPADEIDWRRSALIAAEGQNRAFFGELIRSEILVPNEYESYRVYDVHACWDNELNQGVGCRSPIDGVPEHLHCTPAHVEAGINIMRPGFVTWLTHGSGRGAASVMQMGNVMSLPDDQPFFTFQASCSNSQPMTTQNLSYELLKNGAIGTIGATTISHGPGSPMPSLVNDAGNAGMAYNYAKRLITDGMTAGEALTSLRREVGVNNRWWYWKNYLTFNLWGDPSVGLNNSRADVLAIPQDTDMQPALPDIGATDRGGSGDTSDIGISVDAAQRIDAALDLGPEVVVDTDVEHDVGVVIDRRRGDSAYIADRSTDSPATPDDLAIPSNEEDGEPMDESFSGQSGCNTSPILAGDGVTFILIMIFFSFIVRRNEGRLLT